MEQEKQVVAREYRQDVPKETQNQWLVKWRAGDNKKIEEACGISVSTIINAVKHGTASADVVAKINAYYGITEATAA